MEPDLTHQNSSKEVESAKWILPFYLITGMMCLIVVIEGLLEEVGWIVPPAEQSLPEWLYVIVVIATSVVGFTLIVGLPLAIFIILRYGTHSKFITPAILLTAAEVCFGISIMWQRNMEVFYVVGGTLLMLYGITATGVASVQLWKDN